MRVRAFTHALSLRSMPAGRITSSGKLYFLFALQDSKRYLQRGTRAGPTARGTRRSTTLDSTTITIGATDFRALPPQGCADNCCHLFAWRGAPRGAGHG